jgi:hypothetical protein
VLLTVGIGTVADVADVENQDAVDPVLRDGALTLEVDTLSELVSLTTRTRTSSQVDDIHRR